MDEKKRKGLCADELLENIFYYMSKLFNERDFSKTIQILTSLGRTLVNSDRASFWFWDKNNREYWTIAALDSSKIVVNENTGIIGESISTNQIMLINNAYEDKRFNHEIDKKSGYVTKTILCIPVTNADGEVIGAYQAINKFDEEGNEATFNDNDVKRLSLAAVFCARTLESYMLHNEYMIDQLTGLKNRRGFYDYYNKKIIPNLHENNVCMIMCDIDHFKNVNDIYGHNAGDTILRQLSLILYKIVGIDDEVIRWGGEEFILMIKNKSLEQTVQLAEVMRIEIEKFVCNYEESKINVTMSFGVIKVSINNNIEQNVKMADEKLYQAKETGRNKVVW